jgi:phosphoribosylformylglycinamidine synthase subunit PurL
VRALLRAGRATACHDVSDGGLAVALAEMAMAGGLGAALDAAPDDLPAHGWWFAEDQARYVLTASEAEAARILAEAEKAGIPARRLGTTGGIALTGLGGDPISVARLGEAHETWLPAYMAGG